MKAVTTILFTILSFSGFAQQSLVEGINEFSLEYYKTTVDDSSNYFISPFSLHLALGLVTEGANSTTKTELGTLLNIDGIPAIKLKYKALIDKIVNTEDSIYLECLRWSPDKKAGKNELYIANSIWVNDRIPVNDVFKAGANNYFNSTIEAFTTDNLDRANQRLSELISEQTRGHIAAISPLDETTEVSLVNAVYFHGEWDAPFKRKQTKERKFYSINGETSKIGYLRATRPYRYYEDDQIKSIQIPYSCDQFSFLAFLPHERHGLQELEQMVTYEYLKAIVDSSITKQVILSLPKLEIETETFPKSSLAGLGCEKMFTDEADFSRLSDKPMKIGSITHKTRITLDEKTTKAAAATKVDMIVTGYAGGGDPATPPAPKIFNADHPFFFCIIDNRTSAIVFVGRFAQE